MLVFTRRRNEAIMIADGITVRVIKVGRNGVRIGVEAPSSVPVHRQEVYDQIKAANVSASGASTQLDAVVERLRAAGPISTPAGVP